MWLAIGGFGVGFVAGAAARYGRLCSMSAIEDALVGGDFRAAKAWGLALAVAMVASLGVGRWLALDFADSVYTSGTLDVAGAVLGGALFGLGMALAGTCSFGLLVRVGGGDLRAMVSAVVIGISAFAFTAGALAPVRAILTGLAPVDLAPLGGPLLSGISARAWPQHASLLSVAIPCALAIVLLLAAALDRRLRRRPRLLTAAVALGGAIAAGWAVTGHAIDALETTRLESLSFVAPVGRALLQVMSDSLREVGFGVASVAGVLLGAAVVARAKDDIRWEAFDDAREMRRHLLGAVLMGLGGVLARGCTIGQGMSAASVLAVSAPLVMLGVVIGAKLGLMFLLEGRAMWRMGSSTDR